MYIITEIEYNILNFSMMKGVALSNNGFVMYIYLALNGGKGRRSLLVKEKTNKYHLRNEESAFQNTPELCLLAWTSMKMEITSSMLYYIHHE